MQKITALGLSRVHRTYSASSFSGYSSVTWWFCHLLPFFQHTFFRVQFFSSFRCSIKCSTSWKAISVRHRSFTTVRRSWRHWGRFNCIYDRRLRPLTRKFQWYGGGVVVRQSEKGKKWENERKKFSSRRHRFFLSAQNMLVPLADGLTPKVCLPLCGGRVWEAARTWAPL